MVLRAKVFRHSIQSTVTTGTAPLDEFADLALQPRTRAHGDQAQVEIHPLRESDAFIVSIQPPKVPEGGLQRASCDIVLVIDVSGSMSAAAPLPEATGDNDKEAAGLSVLDLVKHAARTILETLGPGDRLGIVTFSDDATVVQELTFMSASEKKKARQRIESLRDESSTNLWAGIRSGLELFSTTALVDNVQGLYVLTDGMPNHMCPKQGYVNKLGPILKEAARKRASIPTIHTFGFGYEIRSDLMQSIAEVGKGSYAFIPDAGMIGTAFVHSVANLYTTAGTSASLEIQLSNDITLESTGGTSLEKGEHGHLLELGNIQFGQSRDLVFLCRPSSQEDVEITARLNYRIADGSARTSQARALFSDRTGLPQDMVHYHMHRAQICEFLSTLFPLKANGEHTAITGNEALTDAHARLRSIVTAIQSSPFGATLEVKALLDDLVGDEPHGQISKALVSTKDRNYWQKWGRHYLPSLLHAHQRQMCNTFKDPGPLLYGKDSPLFVQCRTELDAAFDSLPAPKPSRPPRVVYTYDAKGRVSGSRTVAYKQVSMASYNSSSAPCFEGNCLVKMGDGDSKPIKSLRPGLLVWTPMGARAIAAILRTRIRGHRQKLCRIGELLVTPWHPVQHDGKWVFPSQVATRGVSFKGSVYSILLTPFPHPNGHAVEIGGQLCVTLGHGLVSPSQSKNDVRAHPFFGSYRCVAVALLRLPVDKNRHLRCGGMMRGPKSGLACGFVKPMAAKRVVGRLGKTLRVR
ncbi:U-box domain containing protein [Cladophialophora carrionii]|uniref:U-box domain containing protein n=1 Tax=Cladophialophora carrionii TaxID=86049 RepID=A0A1C1CLM8_9EURO|nr:U-box domain containing protein [Cladophialophora carrionii]